MRCPPNLDDLLSTKSKRLLVSAFVTALVGLVFALIVSGAIYASTYKQPVPFIYGSGSSMTGDLVLQLLTDYMQQLKITRNLPLVPPYDYDFSGVLPDGWNDLVSGKTSFSGVDTDNLQVLTTDSVGDYESIPLMRSAMAIGYNIPACPNGLNMSVANLAKIWTGTIQTWNDSALVQDSPCLANVTTPIRRMYRTTPSGTTYAFCELLHRFEPNEFLKSPNVSWPYPDPTQSYIVSSNGVTLFLINITEGSIGYLPWSAQDPHTFLNYVSLNSVPMTQQAVLASSRYLQDIGRFPDSEPEHLPTCPSCWPLMTKVHVALRKASHQSPTTALNTSLPSSCINQQETVKFLLWALDQESPVDGYTPLSVPMKEKATRIMSKLECNKERLMQARYTERTKIVVARSASIAGLAVLSVVVSVGLLLIGYNESLYTRDLQLLAAVTGDGEFGMNATLLENCEEYDGQLGLALRNIAPSPEEDEVPSSLNAIASSSSSKDPLIPLNDGTTTRATSATPAHIRISDLTIGRLIGSGSFGDVFKGKYDRQTVAIKRISVAHEPELMQSFLGEVRAMTSLSHPHVLKLVGLSIQAPYTYIISEYCKNGSLDSYARSHPGQVTHRMRIDWMHQVAEGMAYLHSKKVTHRDLKLSNLLLDANLQVKVADLGNAAMNSNQKHRTRAGTVDHSAPEMLEGRPYDQSCDVYSYGICLWALFSNMPLYPGFTMFDIISGVTNGQRPSLDFITSPRLSAIIEACWHQDSSKRPSFAQLVDIMGQLDDSDFQTFA